MSNCEYYFLKMVDKFNKVPYCKLNKQKCKGLCKSYKQNKL